MTIDYQNQVDKVGKELVARAKEMHKQVDNILSTSQKTLQQMKASSLAKLQRQEKYLEDKLLQMKKDVERYENQLRDADPNALLGFQQDPGQNKEKTKPPALETQSPAVFTKGQIDTNAMQDMFGQLSTWTVPQKDGELAKTPPASSHSNPQPTISTDRGKIAASSGTKKSLTPNPSVQSKFDVKYYYPSIVCVERSQAWVQTGGRMLQLVDRDGSVRDTINTDFSIYGMAVTSHGDLLLSDYTKQLYQVSIQREDQNPFQHQLEALGPMLPTQW